MTLKARLSNLLRPASPDMLSQPLVDVARHAKFNEDDNAAMTILERALAEVRGDPAAIYLQQADVLTNAGRYTEAQAAVAAAQKSPQPTMRAYAASAAGWLAQAQGDWAAARTHYEEALQRAKLARAASAEGRAMSQLADTYLKEGNASYAAYLLREALPKLQEPRDVEMSSYFVGLLGQALVQSGQEAEGHHLIGRAIGLAEQIGYRRYLRHWSIVMGERAASEARFYDAQTHFERALELFGRVSAEQVRILCEISKVCLALREQDKALTYAERAVEASVELDEQTRLLARGALGVALRTVGRSAEAVPHLEVASEGLAQGNILRALAAAQADSGDFDAAVATYKAAIKRAETAESPLEVAGAHRDLGLIYLKQDQLPAAIQAWTAALAIYEKHNAPAQVARLYCDIGNARKMLGQGARAMKDYEQALMTLNSVEDYDVETRGLVLSSAANAYAEQGDVESADSFYNEAISIAVRSGDRAAESIRSGNYGYFLIMVGRPRRAIATIERALRFSQSLGLTVQAAVQMDNLGLAYDGLADYEAALRYHQQALGILETANQSYWLASVRVNLANTYMALGRLAEAQAQLDMVTTEQVGEQTEIGIRAQTARALLAIHQGEPATAELPLTTAIAVARRLDMRRWLAEALAARSQQQAALQNPDKAKVAWEEAQRLYAVLHMPQAELAPAWLKEAE